MIGGFVNRVMEGSKQITPEVGMGATITMYSDRAPGTIVKVSPSGKTVWVQHDDYTRIDSRGMSESQEYTYAQNTSAPVEVFRMTKRGFRNKNGDGLFIGKRERYYDFSF